MSGIIYESETGEGLGRFEIDLADGTHRLMTVNVTEEGIIMDVFGRAPQEFSDDTHLGTAGMMFDEWADWVVDADRAEILTTVASHATWENEKPVFP